MIFLVSIYLSFSNEFYFFNPRMPLNAFVVLLLLKIKNLSPQRVFLACAGAHAVSFLSYSYFYSSSGKFSKILFHVFLYS